MNTAHFAQLADNVKFEIVHNVQKSGFDQVSRRDPTDHVRIFQLMPANRRAYQRRNELARLAEYRRKHGLAQGSDLSWATVLANLAPFMASLRHEDFEGDRQRSRDSSTQERIAARVFRLCLHIGITISSVEVREAAAIVADRIDRGEGRITLISSARVGSILEVTSVERDDISAVTFDAVDEPALDRRRRRLREAAARRRARKGARPHSQALSKAKPWDREGISRATWYRRRRAAPTARETESETGTIILINDAPTNLSHGHLSGGSYPQDDGCRPQIHVQRDAPRKGVEVVGAGPAPGIDPPNEPLASGGFHQAQLPVDRKSGRAERFGIVKVPIVARRGTNRISFNGQGSSRYVSISWSRCCEFFRFLRLNHEALLNDNSTYWNCRESILFITGQKPSRGNTQCTRVFFRCLDCDPAVAVFVRGVCVEIPTEGVGRRERGIKSTPDTRIAQTLACCHFLPHRWLRPSGAERTHEGAPAPGHCAKRIRTCCAHGIDTGLISG